MTEESTKYPALVMPTVTWGTVEPKLYHGPGGIIQPYDNQAICTTPDGRRYEKTVADYETGTWEPFWVADDILPKSFRCDCGSERFALTNGDYELRATCECGATAIVYSG